jgi:hypothetical protein
MAVIFTQSLRLAYKALHPQMCTNASQLRLDPDITEAVLF